jgi:hypothetical protein
MQLRNILLMVPLAVIAVPACAPSALAGPREDVQAGSARCAGIADDRSWLDCYYGAAQPMRGKLGLPPAPASQQMLVPAAGPNTPQPAIAPYRTAPAKPGFFERLYTHTEVKAEAPTRMSSYRFENGGFFVVVLANGETWKQVIGDTALANWRDRPEHYTVTIEPAEQLGIMTMKVGKETYRVERLR